MRFRLLAPAIVLAALPLAVLAQVGTAAAPLTLADALRLAESANPALQAKRAQLAAADGAVREAGSALFNNPELSYERTRRRTPQAGLPDARGNEWAAGVSQAFEIAGQRSRRRDAAAAGLDAVRAELDDARRQTLAEAATRFHGVLAAQNRVQIEQRSLELLQATAQAVAKRRAAGEDTRLDANVATVEAERARNALARAGEQLLDARTELAALLQLPPDTLPEVAGDLAAVGEAPAYDLMKLLSSVQEHPKQRALALREDAARARLGLERASRYPDVSVGISVGREGSSDARERVTMLSVSVPVPLFKRNDAAVGQAMTEVAQAEIERAAAIRGAQAQVRRLWSRLESQRERVRRLQQAMLPAATDNQQLSLKSRTAGQIGLIDQIAVNRQALEAERELNEALAEFNATRIELEYAAGWPREGTSR